MQNSQSTTYSARYIMKKALYSKIQDRYVVVCNTYINRGLYYYPNFRPLYYFSTTTRKNFRQCFIAKFLKVCCFCEFIFYNRIKWKYISRLEQLTLQSKSALFTYAINLKSAVLHEVLHVLSSFNFESVKSCHNQDFGMFGT